MFDTDFDGFITVADVRALFSKASIESMGLVAVRDGEAGGEGWRCVGCCRDLDDLCGRAALALPHPCAAPPPPPPPPPPPQPATEAELVAMITDADTDGDGRLTLEDFKAVLEQVK
jgi:hypothetical protein